MVGGLFGGSTPKEDPAVKAMRERQQRQAEADRLKAIQQGLADETAATAQSGARSLLGPLGIGSSRGRRSLLGGG